MKIIIKYLPRALGHYSLSIAGSIALAMLGLGYFANEIFFDFAEPSSGGVMSMVFKVPLMSVSLIDGLITLRRNTNSFLLPIDVVTVRIVIFTREFAGSFICINSP